MQIDWHDLLLAARECEASYIADDAAARAAFAALGCTVLDRLSEDGAQAVAVIAPDGGLDLIITGTRFSEGTFLQHLTDLAQDAYFRPTAAAGGFVPAGALARITRIWAWFKSMVGSRKVRVRGHSLGGQGAHAMPSVMSAELIFSITAFEPPKAGDAAFWKANADILPLLFTVVHAGDMFFAWPPLADGLLHPPCATLFLHRDPGQWQLFDSADPWPGANPFTPGDHDIGIVRAGVETILSALKETAQ
jgi:hypothetical protein